MGRKQFLLMLAMTVLLPALTPARASAETPLLPDVTDEMTEASYWTERMEDADLVLADAEQIRTLNQRFTETPACMMTDLEHVEKDFDERAFYRNLWKSAFADAASRMSSSYYDDEGVELTGAELNARLENIGGEYVAEKAKVRYGICVRRADLLSLPGENLMTDEQGDLDFDYNQISSVRVNEPVIVKADSKDGVYYYCDTDCVSGWVRADDIALCTDREEWLSAWNIPDKEAIVVTDGKLYLENSNFSPDSSEVLLTMGTVLRKVADSEYDAAAVNRAPFHNYAVWLPVRMEDGSYGRTIALIPQNRSVSEGCLPLTCRNIVEVACSRLGDVYGWGGMLNSVDCSNYVRDVYRCFGLVLPRNTTWQSRMPVLKYDVSGMEDQEKEALLDTLPPGTVLYFSGHEMLYLGSGDGEYYVISAISSIRNFDENDTGRLRVRSIVINSLDVQRMNGRTWLQELNLMLLPYAPEEAAEEGSDGTENSAEPATEEESAALEEEQDLPAENSASPEPGDSEQAAGEERQKGTPAKTRRKGNGEAEQTGETADSAEKPIDSEKERESGSTLSLSGDKAHNKYMQQAIEEALYGISQQHGGPFGCVLVRDGVILGTGHDRSTVDGDPNSHGEQEAIREAAEKLGTDDLTGCILYTTAEPCSDCLLACAGANLKGIRYGCTLGDCERFGLRNGGLNEPDDNRDDYKMLLICKDRSACLRLFEFYTETAEKPAA